MYYERFMVLGVTIMTQNEYSHQKEHNRKQMWTCHIMIYMMILCHIITHHLPADIDFIGLIDVTRMG